MVSATTKVHKFPAHYFPGDAYRYTIQPVFDNIKAEHQCHIRRHRPKILYELFYFVQIPGTNFQTSNDHRTVYASDDLDLRSSGKNIADFLTVDHNYGIERHEEFILYGLEGDDSRVNYSVHWLRPKNEKDPGKVTIHDISNLISVAATQFERPFDFSTSTWTNQNDCRKNVTKFRQPLKRNATFYRNVNVAIQKSSDSFRYFLKSVDNPPFIRFNVPGRLVCKFLKQLAFFLFIYFNIKNI